MYRLDFGPLLIARGMVSASTLVRRAACDAITSLDSWSRLRFVHIASLLRKYSSSKDDRLLQRLQLACSGLEAGLQLRWLGAELKLHELLRLLPH